MFKANKVRMAMYAGFLAAAAIVYASIPNRAAASDLTIEVAGDLAKHGGVVTVYAIKVSQEDWANTIAPNALDSVRVEQRYAEIQLRYPSNGTFVYRFRPADAATPDARQATFVLSIIGTNENGEGSELKSGFKGASPSGGRIIRVPPPAEIAGESEATRSMARWGEVVGRDAPPPADSRSARSLAVVAGDDVEQPSYVCRGAANVQVCTIATERWPLMEARWWRNIADARLERLRHHALRRCYDSRKIESARNCEPVPGSDEPEYLTPK
jgi:hypothetical protein